MTMHGRPLRKPEQLPPAAALNESERAFFAAHRTDGCLPFKVTQHYLSLIDWTDPEDPIRRQCIPRREELNVRPCELSDPLGEDLSTASPRLIHRYPDRALLLVTDRCAAYCRHCFRRRFSGRVGRSARSIGAVEVAAAAAYLRRHPEIRELIFSGGDPLTLPDGKLSGLLARFRGVDPTLAFRLHTRMPVVQPRRFTTKTAEKLAAFRPLRLVTQFNHPRELCTASRLAISALMSHDIPVLNQAVLLRGINDDVGTQLELIRTLIEAGIKPYYLFQGDLAQGTTHLRVPLEKGLRLMEEIKAVSGLPDELLPVYALDQPGAGGKIALSRETILEKTAEHYVLAGWDGRTCIYPVEK